MAACQPIQQEFARTIADAGKLQDLLGQPQMTSYDAGISQTLGRIRPVTNLFFSGALVLARYACGARLLSWIELAISHPHAIQQPPFQAFLGRQDEWQRTILVVRSVREWCIECFDIPSILRRDITTSVRLCEPSSNRQMAFCRRDSMNVGRPRVPRPEGIFSTGDVKKPNLPCM